MPLIEGSMGNPNFECWLMLPNVNIDEFGIGVINGVEYEWIVNIVEQKDAFETAVNFIETLNVPKNACVVQLRMKNIQWVDMGNEAPSYCTMDAELIDFQTDENPLEYCAAPEMDEDIPF